MLSPNEFDLTKVVADDEPDSTSSSNDKPPIDHSYLEGLTIVLKVRSVPGPVNKLSVRLSTILGVLIWEFSSNHSGGYPVKSFTAEFRKYCSEEEINGTQQWHQLDPENIPSNVVRINEIFSMIFQS